MFLSFLCLPHLSLFNLLKYRPIPTVSTASKLKPKSIQTLTNTGHHWHCQSNSNQSLGMTLTYPPCYAWLVCGGWSMSLRVLLIEIPPVMEVLQIFLWMHWCFFSSTLGCPSAHTTIISQQIDVCQFSKCIILVSIFTNHGCIELFLVMV